MQLRLLRKNKRVYYADMITEMQSQLKKEARLQSMREQVAAASAEKREVRLEQMSARQSERITTE